MSKSSTKNEKFEQKNLGLVELWRESMINNYSNFSGRATRREFWYVSIMNAAIAVFFQIGMFIFNSSSMLSTVWSTIMAFAYLLVLIPSFALTVRRLHDTNRSEWWMLILLVPVFGPITLLVFELLPGDEGKNEYGAPANYTYAG